MSDPLVNGVVVNHSNKTGSDNFVSGFVKFLECFAALACLVCFLGCMYLGTSSLFEYKWAISRTIHFRDNIIQSYIDQVNKSIDEAQNDTVLSNYLSNLIQEWNNTDNPDKTEKLKEKVDDYINNQFNDSLNSDTSLEINKENFSITANNAIIVILLQYILGMVFLFFLIRYFIVIPKKGK